MSQGVPPQKFRHGTKYISDKNSVWFNSFLVDAFIPQIPGLIDKLGK